jgi:hypothetical protein
MSNLDAWRVRMRGVMGEFFAEVDGPRSASVDDDL